MPRIKRKKKNLPLRFTSAQILTLKQRALELYKADEGHAKELGKALLELKSALRGAGKGAFELFWTAHKLSQHRVSYCMRLAQGKVKAAKLARTRSPERVAASEVKQRIDKFLKFCANERNLKTVGQLNAAWRDVSFFMLSRISRMRHWPMNSTNGPKVQVAVRKFEQALEGLIDVAFVTVPMEDLEKITNRDMPRASDYGFGQSKPSARAKAAGA